jgi:hypothetical protein
MFFHPTLHCHCATLSYRQKRGGTLREEQQARRFFIGDSEMHFQQGALGGGIQRPEIMP